MLVQYLVGLCCLKWSPDAVDVTLGDMVLDPAAGKERDVDVTVTVQKAGQTTHAFKAYEVKHEGKPLDVAAVEQLCIKVNDMSSVTHRGIVSASGFTDAAQKKAKHHGVDLYELCPWTRPLEEQFPALAPMSGRIEDCFPFSSFVLTWASWMFHLNAPDAQGSFSVEGEAAVLRRDGKPHKRFKTMEAYKQDLLLRSTEILWPLEPAASIFRTLPIPFQLPDGSALVGPAWPHTHTLDVSADEVYVTASGKLCRLSTVTISGHLQWRRSALQPRYYVIEQLPDRNALAGALIAMGAREGQMTVLVLSPDSRSVSVSPVQLSEGQLRSIRRLALHTGDSTDREPRERSQVSAAD